MTAVAVPPIAPDRSPVVAPIVLKGVSWAAYVQLRDDTDRAGQKVYLTYDRGTLEIMPPSLYHEWYKTLIGSFIDVIRLELRVRLKSGGSTTFRREDLERGLEPDQCYYVQHEPQMRGKTEVDLHVDPPPDLAVEIDYKHRAISRESIYAALGVPEIWVYDGKGLHVYARDAEGTYQAVVNSVAFPFLRPGDLQPFMRQAVAQDECEAIWAFRDWLLATHGGQRRA